MSAARSRSDTFLMYRSDKKTDDEAAVNQVQNPEEIDIGDDSDEEGI